MLLSTTIAFIQTLGTGTQRTLKDEVALSGRDKSFFSKIKNSKKKFQLLIFFPGQWKTVRRNHPFKTLCSLFRSKRKTRLVKHHYHPVEGHD